MNLRNAVGGLSRFAHLAGRPATPSAAKTKAEETPATTDEVEEVEEKVEDVEDKVDELEAKVDDLADEFEDAEEEETDEVPAATAKAMRTGAARERARCSAIFASPHAAANLPLAANLAFETNLTAKQAIGALAAGGQAPKADAAPQKRGLSDRMHGQPATRIGTTSNDAINRDSPEGAAASIHAAMKLARGQK